MVVYIKYILYNEDMKTTYETYKAGLENFVVELKSATQDLELVYHEDYSAENKEWSVSVKDKSSYNHNHSKEVFINGQWIYWGHTINGGGFSGSTKGSIMRTFDRYGNPYRYYFIVGDNQQDKTLKVWALDKNSFPVKVAHKPYNK